MSDYSDVPQCGDFLDESLWLSNMYSEMVSIPNAEVKKTECKKSETKVKKNSAKKIDSKNTDSKKSSPNHDNWLGYIIAVFINETIDQSIECCPGCKDLKNSPLFHSHHHSGLLEKLYMFTPSVRAILVSMMLRGKKF